MSLNEDRAIAHLLDLLSVQGLSGQERPVATLIREKLLAAGCPADCIHEDDAHTRIGQSFEMGNLIVRLPGTVDAPRVMVSGHMDTVPLTRGAKPVRSGDRIVPEGSTALGADNRTACAAMVTLVETLLTDNLPHPPLTLLFTVGEEIGLWGAKEVDPADLGHPVMGFNIDSGDPRKVVIGAIGAHRWQVQVDGISAHAGVHPEHGVSAALIASRAVTAIAEQGYFGLIVKGEKRGTSNIGSMEGGEATNQVTDRMRIKGESRSHDPEFLEEITGVIRTAFEQAAASVTNHLDRAGRITFTCQRDYHAFRIREDDEVVNRTRAAQVELGLDCLPEVTNGGLDANFLNAKGIPTVTLGAGQHNPHTIDEYADIPEYLTCCRLLMRIMQG